MNPSSAKLQRHSAIVFRTPFFIALNAAVPADTFWRSGSGLQAIWMISIGIYRIRQATVAGVTRMVGVIFQLTVTISAFASFALQQSLMQVYSDR